EDYRRRYRRRCEGLKLKKQDIKEDVSGDDTSSFFPYYPEKTAFFGFFPLISEINHVSQGVLPMYHEFFVYLFMKKSNIVESQQTKRGTTKTNCKT
ncbi:MAG: hypothetical protein Q4F29_10905, partial [Lachnospiraceae bacterium]|nr:hypothetical protein [Lachnospiraceae bacterium]